MQANHGRREWFTVLGVPVGKAMPLSDALLRGLAKRAGLGIGRSGSPGGNSSGDNVPAFSTADPMPEQIHAGPVIMRRNLNWNAMDPVYEAAVQAVDESAINAIVQGEDVPHVKPRGGVCPGIDTAALCRLVLG